MHTVHTWIGPCSPSVAFGLLPHLYCCAAYDSSMHVQKQYIVMSLSTCSPFSACSTCSSTVCCGCVCDVFVPLPACWCMCYSAPF